MLSLKEQIASLPKEILYIGDISIRPIENDYDLWFAVVECRLAPGQEDFVNPAGFSIGRAYLNPDSNLPCIIWKGEERIGYIVLRRWAEGTANSWSFYLDKDYQGKGWGKTAAELAVQILRAADPEMPIKLSTEKDNLKAQSLYQAIGFHHDGEMDGDDLVFVL